MQLSEKIKLVSLFCLFCLFCFSVQHLAEYFTSDMLADAEKHAKYNLSVNSLKNITIHKR